MPLPIDRRPILGAIVALPFWARQAASQTADNFVETAMTQKARFIFAGHSVTATLYDTVAARDFMSMLPLELKVEDYSTTEKITYLPRRLTETGAGPFTNEAPGDLCYYMPWGNLAMFHGRYQYSSGLLRLGKFDDGPTPLLTRGEFPLRIERA
jgi:hypothetical protein